MYKIKQLDYYITRACNLSCKFCLNYSNFHGPSKLVTIDQVKEEWGVWSKRLEPRIFSILGGEPTLHPKLSSLLEIASKTWTFSKICLITNGFFLHRHKDLAEICKDKDIYIRVSIHNIGSVKRKEILEYVDKLRQQGVRIKIRYQYRKGDVWTKYYNIVEGEPTPFTDEAPRQSWKKCNYKSCKVLHNNAIYKCPQIAASDVLPDTFTHFKEYKPFTLNDSRTIQEFCSLQEETCCSHCPSTPRIIKIGSSIE